MRVGSLFSGHGQLDFGLTLAGFEHSWFVEFEPFRRDILGKRWPGVPVFDDIRDTGADELGPVDVIAGGFPCKGASTAGKREGFGHPETVLWREMRRIVGELRPSYVLVENVANILGIHRGAVWGEVLGDLATLGFDVVWDCLPAAAVGAPHRRDRVFAVASHPERVRPERTGGPRPGGTRLENGGSPSADPQREPSKLRRGHGPIHGSTGDPKGAPRERQRDWASAGGGGEAPADSPRDAEGGAETASGSERERVGVRAGVAVEWGEYGPTIHRWEQIHGPAPEPLVRRVDGRSAARVERSRLSALGDGVQVQLGAIAGSYILDLREKAA